MLKVAFEAESEDALLCTASFRVSSASAPVLTAVLIAMLVLLFDLGHGRLMSAVLLAVGETTSCQICTRLARPRDLHDLPYSSLEFFAPRSHLPSVVADREAFKSTQDAYSKFDSKIASQSWSVRLSCVGVEPVQRRSDFIPDDGSAESQTRELLSSRRAVADLWRMGALRAELVEGVRKERERVRRRSGKGVAG